MAADPIHPPLFGIAPARLCTRWVGDRNCGEPAVMHVLWDEAMENGCVCAEHVKELGSRWAFLQVHELGPDCGMPGSMWFFEENTCRCADELAGEVFPTVEAICRDYGGGGNRTRVLSTPESLLLQGVRHGRP